MSSSIDTTNIDNVPLGHNNPPSAIYDISELPATLAERNLDLVARIAEIDSAFDRWKLIVTKPRIDAEGKPVQLADGTPITEIKIVGADINERSIDFAKKVKSLLDTIEARREETKKPFLDGGRVVDAYYKTTLADQLASINKALRAAVQAYADERVEQERLAALEAARIEQEAAERMAQAAQRASSPEAMDAAIDLESRAHARAADASGARGGFTAAKTTTQLGSAVHMRGVWKHRIIDPNAIKRAYCSPDPVKINAAIRAATTKDGCALKITGVEIYFDRSISVR